MARYIPFPAYHDFAPLDISYLFESEKPAGKHGFLKTEGDRFVFEDGTKVRFWGTCLNSGACFPDKDYAPKLAKRIASYGCNMVRLHQMDAEWATPNLFQVRKGKRMANTQTPDPESFDRLDYFLSCLKQEGIYVYLDVLTYRKYKEADGLPNTEQLKNCGSPYSLFDPTMIRLQKEFAAMLWNHHNPYTGLAYKDDPLFVLCDVVNEVDLFTNFGRTFGVEPYTAYFRELFRQWLEQQGIEDVDAQTIDLDSFDCEPLNDFKISVEEKFFDEMFSHLRSIGVKIPFTGINFSWRHISCKANQHIGDYCDSHLNQRDTIWEPGKKFVRHIAFHNVPEWGAMRNARMRHFGKPFFTSEWDLTYPNKYRAESSILLSAVNMLQNWSGCTIHTYAYTSLLQHMKTLGKEISSESIGGVGYREGVFSTWNDPAKFGLFYHAAIITRREDVKCANNKITVRIQDLENGGGRSRKALDAATELSQIAVDYYGDCPDAVDEHTPLVDLEAGEVTSDTGELYRSWKKGYGTIDTPMTKAVYGDLNKNGTITMQGMSVTCENEFAVIALSSLNNDLDIAHTDAMLLSAVGDATNTGTKFAPAPEHMQKSGRETMMEMVDAGQPPILAEVIEAQIAIKTERKNMVVWAVNAEGIFTGNVPTVYEDGYLKFNIGGTFSSVYYFIQAE